MKKINNEDVPNWVLSLDQESLEFVKRFILNSGSLKKISKIYGVSYPTVRTRLDNLIQKIELNDNEEDVEFITMIKNLVIDERIGLEDAKTIINKYKNEISKKE